MQLGELGVARNPRRPFERYEDDPCADANGDDKKKGNRRYPASTNSTVR
jgi:hypothetical protein